MKRSVHSVSALLLLSLLSTPVIRRERSPIDDDESVILFRTTAHLVEGTNHWRIPIHGWIFEPELDSRIRAALLTSLAKSLDLKDKSDESQIFHDRAWAFIVDNERGQDVSVRVGSLEIQAEESEANGHFQGEQVVEQQDIESTLAEAAANDGWVGSAAVTRSEDLRHFEGAVQFVSPSGVSVISDIDDTVKVSEVRNRRALLENTFLKPFVPVPGMSSLYREWRRSGAVFHYVTASPWQLYQPLTRFMEETGLPAGEMHMKRFRFKDSDFLNLFDKPQDSKPPVIEGILELFPRRRFVLVGDSGEADPEVYGELARRHAEQIRLVLIHDVTNEPADAGRYEAAFRDLPEDRWRVFEDASSLTGIDITKLP